MPTQNVVTTEDALRKRKEEFVEFVGMGLSPILAGKRVGIKDATTRRYMKDPLVQKILKKIHNENIRALQMDRDKVQAIVLEAVEMGRVQADPLAMIRGAQELNKMCGFYAAEEKKIILTVEQRRTITQFDDMSDEDIAKMIESGNMAEAIEAEFEEIAES